MGKLINLVAFQVTWLACVWSAGAGKPVWGAAVFAVSVTLHLLLSNNRKGELLLLITAGAVGLAAESVLVAMGAIQFPGAWLPFWMILLWANFATTLRVSLAWLQGRYVVAAIAGAVAGPLAYLGGQRLGAIEVQQPLAVAVEWAVATPLLLWFARER